MYGLGLVHDAGDVATRPCQRFNEAQAHRYTRTGHDDGYLRGLAARRIERLRVAHHNDIDLESTEFRRQLEEARWIQVGITHLQHHVSPLLPAVLAQAINQRLQHRRSHRRVQC